MDEIVKDKKLYIFSLPRRNPLVLKILTLSIILLLIFISIESVIYFRQLNRANLYTNPPIDVSVLSSKNESNSHVVAWSNTAEKLPSTTLEIPIYDSKQQDTLIRAKGTLNEIINPSEKFVVNLFSEKTITVLVTPETYTGKAQFGKDKEGTIAAINYLQIQKDTLNKLKVGQTISLGYYQKEYVSEDKGIPLVEFVLF